jgi:hypothetical protein
MRKWGDETIRTPGSDSRGAFDRNAPNGSIQRCVGLWSSWTLRGRVHKGGCCYAALTKDCYLGPQLVSQSQHHRTCLRKSWTLSSNVIYNGTYSETTAGTGSRIVDAFLLNVFVFLINHSDFAIHLARDIHLACHSRAMQVPSLHA